MGAVTDEFERQLAEMARRWSEAPRREIEELLLIAMEREEIVAVAYAEGMLGRRIDRMPLPPEASAILKQALAWTWKDEEMHAVYVRGAIFRLARLPLRMTAYRRQLEGAVGGWASFVRQHLSWRQAPMSRLAATLLTWMGTATGRIPGAVRRHLQHGPFRAFCDFNVDAEQSAAACWRRLLALSDGQDSIPTDIRREFERMAADETRHGLVFTILRDSLGDDDRLKEGVTVEQLARALGRIDEPFVPRRWRSAALAHHPLGSGGDVLVRRGGAGADASVELRALLAELDLGGSLERRARELGRPVGALRVVVKPAFMLGYHRDDLSPVTSPGLVRTLVEVLRELGVVHVVVAEAPNIYDRFFGARTVRDVGAYFGLHDLPLLDLASEQVPHAYSRGMHQASIARSWRDADVRIAFGKLRSHPIDSVYLTLGTVEGVGGRWDDYLFPERSLDRHAALMMLLHEFPPDVALLDAWGPVPDGLLGMMGSRRALSPHRLYGGRDALAVDLVAARHVGAPLARSGQLRAACHWFGDPTAATRVKGADAPVDGWRGPRGTLWSALLCHLAYPAYACGSGRGSLFVPAMDERAFPPLRSPGIALRGLRSGCRWMLGLPNP